MSQRALLLPSAFSLASDCSPAPVNSFSGQFDLSIETLKKMKEGGVPEVCDRRELGYFNFSPWMARRQSGDDTTTRSNDCNGELV
jgi:hypothetical protein